LPSLQFPITLTVSDPPHDSQFGKKELYHCCHHP
jgi:hypothetical protein